MRRLAWFSGGFCAAALAAALALPPLWVLLPALAVCALTALFCRAARLRAAVLFLGLTAGLLWCAVWAAGRLERTAPWDGRTVSVTAEVSGYSRETAYGFAADVVLELDGRRQRAVLYGSGDWAFRPGDRISGYLELQANDGCWGGEGQYAASRGIDWTARLTGTPTVERAGAVPLRYAPAAAAHALEDVLCKLLRADEAAYATALLTGRRDGISDRLDGQLRRSGTLHVVAVSGMHISILMGAVLLLLGSRRRLGALIGLPMIWLFSLAVGMTASVVRAAVMQTMLLLAPAFRRENDPPTALMAALLVLIVPNPRAILDVGLQLSFTSVAGILLFSGKCYGILASPRPIRWLLSPGKDGARRLLRLPAMALRAVLSGAAAALAVFPLTMPLNLLYFSGCSLAAPLSSALIVPWIPAAFVLTAAVAAIGTVTLPAAAVLAVPLSALLQLLLRLTGWIADLPFASVGVEGGYLGWFLAGLCGLLLTVLLSQRPVRAVLPVCCGSVLFCLSLLLSSLELDRSELSVTVLDVGQGLCVYAESAGVTALYDCGGEGAPAETVRQYLQDCGRFSLDLLIVSHYDTDHAGGVPALLQALPVRQICLPAAADEAGRQADILEAAAASGTAVTFLTEDTSVTFGSAALTLLAPARASEGNEGCVAALWQSRELDVLITGDLPAAAEAELVARAGLTDVEVLVAGHHGAATSTGEDLLRALQPGAVLISVGAENGYGHPAPETLARLADCGADVYRTDQCGSITVRN